MNIVMKVSFHLLIGLLLTHFVTSAHAQSLETSVEGISEYRLDNGLKVLLFPDPSKQTITVNITYLVGSRHENYGETGMAHLLEHLLFKGSPNHPNIPAELTAHGARPNGTTWFDRTNYFETFAANDENLQWALDLEADRMTHSFVAQKDLDTEMTVVRNEFESGENDPGSILEERMMSTAYLWHNYGNSTIGSRTDIENVPIERLQAFYKTYYQPDNAVLLVAGKFNQAKTLALINDYFGKIAKPSRRLPTIYTLDPTQDGEREITLRRTGDVQIVGAAYHIPGGAHPDFAALDILSEILGDEPSGRLYKSLIETKQAANISSFAYQLHDPGIALMFAEVRQGDSLTTARDTLINTVEGLSLHPPTQEEVERARATLLKQIELNLNDSASIGRTLSEWIGMGDWRLYFLHRDHLRSVTQTDVQRAAAYYFKASNRTIGLFIPTDKPDRTDIPASPDVNALVKNYKGDPARAIGEEFDPSPTNIDSRTVRNTSASGIKLALLSKKTRGSTVTATLTLRFGSEQSLKRLSTVGAMTGAMLMRGTHTLSRQQITDELNRLQARIRLGGSATAATVNIETTREKLPQVLQLIADLLKNSSFPATEFDLLKQERLAEIEQQRSEPQSLAMIALQKQLNPYPKGDVRYVSSIDESIADLNAVTLDQVKEFHKQFYGANTGELSVVGDFDAPALATQVDQLFGGWHAPENFTRIANLYQPQAAINQAIQANDKANAVFYAGIPLQLRDDDLDYPSMVLANYMLGGGFLNSRLAVRVRQQEGLSYGVGSQFSASSLDHVGTFLVYAIYAPQNRDKVEQAIKEELQRAIQNGFTTEEIQAAKSGWLQSRQVSRAQDSELANKLGTYQFLNRTLSWDDQLEKQVAALTSDQIIAALKRHLNLTQLNIVKAGDFTKVNKATSP